MAAPAVASSPGGGRLGRRHRGAARRVHVLGRLGGWRGPRCSAEDGFASRTGDPRCESGVCSSRRGWLGAQGVPSLLGLHQHPSS